MPMSSLLEDFSFFIHFMHTNLISSGWVPFEEPNRAWSKAKENYLFEVNCKNLFFHSILATSSEIEVSIYPLGEDDELNGAQFLQKI